MKRVALGVVACSLAATFAWAQEVPRSSRFLPGVDVLAERTDAVVLDGARYELTTVIVPIAPSDVREVLADRCAGSLRASGTMVTCVDRGHVGPVLVLVPSGTGTLVRIVEPRDPPVLDARAHRATAEGLSFTQSDRVDLDGWTLVGRAGSSRRFVRGDRVRDVVIDADARTVTSWESRR